MYAVTKLSLRPAMPATRNRGATILNPGEGMDVRILGPLCLRHGTAHGRLTAAKPRKVLALLLVHADQVAPVGTLARELWRDRPPASASTTLQTYVLQVRRMLRDLLAVDAAQVASEVLVTCSGGYEFRLGDGVLDLHAFERLSTAGRRALASGDNVYAARALADALALWRGPALVDVPAGPLLAVEVRRLEEDRLTAVQQRIEADLRLDRHHDVLSELTGLAAQYPLHENLNAQYMLALYRAGRRTDALQAYHRLRTVLVGELGLEPSPQIQRLQQAILTGDPELERVPVGGEMLLDRLSREPVHIAWRVEGRPEFPDGRVAAGGYRTAVIPSPRRR